MKKAEIKRRKRVIPAAQSPNQPLLPAMPLAYEGLLNPEEASGPGAVQLPPMTPPPLSQGDPSRRLPPPPVDFTNHRFSPPTQPTSPPRRKRTHSEANSPSGANGHTITLPERNGQTQSEERPQESEAPRFSSIDPRLGEAAKRARSKEDLRREAERVRNQLQALEAQLQGMEDEEQS